MPQVPLLSLVYMVQNPQSPLLWGSGGIGGGNFLKFCTNRRPDFAPKMSISDHITRNIALLYSILEHRPGFGSLKFFVQEVIECLVLSQIYCELKALLKRLLYTLSALQRISLWLNWIWHWSIKYTLGTPFSMNRGIQRRSGCSVRSAFDQIRLSYGDAQSSGRCRPGHTPVTRLLPPDS